MMDSIVFLNGFFVKLQNARVSIMDRGFCYGDGLFETLRAYNGKVFRLDLHWDRLYRSAPMIHLDLPLTRGELSVIIQETLRRNNYSDAIIRLTITRGESAPGLQIDPTTPPTLVVFARPTNLLPEHCYRNGVAVSLFTSSACRTGGISKQVKSCNYLSQILFRALAESQKSFEAILFDDKGQATEGATSNIFIIRNSIIKTPPLNEYVLPGVTRHVIFEIARHKGIACQEQELTREDILTADEVFLTNTGVEVLPVCQADNCKIGDGKPGKVTQILYREFLNIVEEQTRIM